MHKRKVFQPKSRLKWAGFASRFLEALDTPVSLGVALRLKYGEIDQLLEMECNPLDYSTAADFFLDYQAVKLLSKFPNLNSSHDPLVNAQRKFLECEFVCASTNDRIKHGKVDWRNLSTSARSAYCNSRLKIARLLGPVPKLEQLNFRFGPGAAYGVRGETSVYNKLHAQIEHATPMLPIVEEFFSEFPSWLRNSNRQADIVRGSELTFVPKNAKTHRPICIEPLLNGLYQKGVGSYMRHRLMRWGVNLDDQTINQKLAAVAVEKDLCTIDFSSASDLIAYLLVMDLLPFEWFEFLDVARCPSYSFDGNWYDFHKFTSMGNAYTFELETLILFAFAVSACETAGVPYSIGENLHVYGDDVIIPRGAYDLFQEICNYAGFSINLEKTFTSGLFRESCGHDYFDGSFVRPFQLKKDIRTVEDAYYVANEVLRTRGKLAAIARSQQVPVAGNTAWPAYRKLGDVHSWVLGTIPRKLRHLGPEGHGDGHLVCDFSTACPPRAGRQWDGWRYRSVTRPPLKIEFEPDSIWNPAYPLYYAGSGTGSLRGPMVTWDLPDPPDNGSGYTVRNKVGRRVANLICFGTWPDCPPWTERSLAMRYMPSASAEGRTKRTYPKIKGRAHRRKT